MPCDQVSDGLLSIHLERNTAVLCHRPQCLVFAAGSFAWTAVETESLRTYMYMYTSHMQHATVYKEHCC